MMHIETMLVHEGEHEAVTNSVSPPIYQTSTFRQYEVGQKGGYQYSRGSNPTRSLLERQMAKLEGGARAFAFSSVWRQLRLFLTYLQAEWLRARPEVRKVYYLGFDDHPGFNLHFSQARSAGTVISFDVGDGQLARHMLSRVKLAVLGDGLGAVETLIGLPDLMSHGSVPTVRKQQMGITPGLIRLSVGIEHADDIIADLEQALRRP